MSSHRTQLVIRVLTRGVLAILLLVFGGSVYLWLVATSVEAEKSPPLANVREVLAIPAVKRSLNRTFLGYGTAEPVNSADVPSEVRAAVVSIAPGVEDGRRVKAGQLLATLNAEDFEKQVKMAEQDLAGLRALMANLNVEETRLLEQRKLQEQIIEINRREYERILQMQRTASQRDRDETLRVLIDSRDRLLGTLERLEQLPGRQADLTAQLESARVRLADAQEQLSRTKIYSPIDGVIQEVDIEVGESLAVGHRVARIVDLTRVEVPLKLRSSARGLVGEGDPVFLASTADRTRCWDGSITRVAPEDDPNSRTMTVYVDVDQPNANAMYAQVGGRAVLNTGLFVEGRVTSREPVEAWVVPARSIRNDRVMIVEDAKIRRVEAVELFKHSGGFDDLGVIDELWVAIEAPLEPGAPLVLNPSPSMYEGAPARAVLNAGVAEAGDDGPAPHVDEPVGPSASEVMVTTTAGRAGPASGTTP